MLISSFYSGDFEISIYDSIKGNIESKWKIINSSNLTPEYLRFIEDSKPLDLGFRYILIEKDEGNNKVICGIVYFQLLKFAKKNIRFEKSIVLTFLSSLILKLRPFYFLICGNVFAVNFPSSELNHNKISQREFLGVLKEIENQIKCDIYIIKDLDRNFSFAEMSEFGWIPYDTDLTMSLNINPAWLTLDGYTKSLTKKYKKRTEKIRNAGKQITRKELNAQEILEQNDHILHLLKQVCDRQTIRMGLIGPIYFYEFKKRFPEVFSMFGYYYKNKLIAFSSYIDHGQVLEIHYIGIDYFSNKELMIYFNILLDGVERALIEKKSQLELGRTAREAKANLGGIPEYFNDYIKVKGKLASLLSKRFTKYFQEEMGNEWKERHPFR